MEALTRRVTRTTLRVARGLRVTVARNTWTVFGFSIPVAFATVYASAHFWVCDDAHISFRYARNLLEGHGLVYNPGERVEGYTNFLWVLETAALYAVGIPPAVASAILSVLATAAVFVLTVLLARTTPAKAFANTAAWAALMLLATNRNVAVWTTSGLETRQFTALVLLSVLLVHRYPRRPSMLLWTSLALALAALTRPEGVLLWLIVLLWYLIDAAARRQITVKGLVRLALPFALIVGSHLLWRRAYYGDWLPNTYYTKYFRACEDMGLLYYSGAALESALYLTLPLFFFGALYRWVRAKDSLHVLSALLIVPHALYFVRVGGDHFEFRLLDFYWPLLALGTADALVALMLGARLFARSRHWPLPKLASRSAGMAALGIVVVYASALQVAQFVLEYSHRGDKDVPGHIETKLTRDSFPAVFALPFMDEIAPAYQATMSRLLKHAVAVRWIEHRIFQQKMQQLFGPYDTSERAQFPSNAVLAYACVGIVGFSLPEVTIIDMHGLTDKTIARAQAPSNDSRVMAHDRAPPPGYLKSRGANITIEPAARTIDDALIRASYAAELAPGLWAPFSSQDPDWVARAFRGLPYFHLPFETPQRAVLGGRKVTEVRRLLDCENEPEGWSLRGLECAASVGAGQSPVTGQIGRSWLSSFLSPDGDGATGKAVSPDFRAHAGAYLVFKIAGGDSKRVGVALAGQDGRRLASWRGHNSERLDAVVHDLTPYAGKALRVEVFDRDPHAWGHVLTDEMMIVDTGTPAPAQLVRVTGP